MQLLRRISVGALGNREIEPIFQTDLIDFQIIHSRTMYQEHVNGEVGHGGDQQ